MYFAYQWCVAISASRIPRCSRVCWLSSSCGIDCDPRGSLGCQLPVELVANLLLADWGALASSFAIGSPGEEYREQ